MTEKDIVEFARYLDENWSWENFFRDYFNKKKPEDTGRPNLKDVESFFVESQSTIDEARNFFNHFESQDWYTGGYNPQPISRWKPKARQWIDNSRRYKKVDNKSNYNPTKPKTNKCVNCGKKATMTVDRNEFCSIACSNEYSSNKIGQLANKMGLK